MKCIIPSVNLKTFGKAIHCLAKIGFEIYIEVLEKGMELKTVNSSRSSYFCFNFKKANFSFYDSSLQNNSVGDGEFFRCKIVMKSILQVFKSLNNIERSVEQCTIRLDQNESRLVFQLKCRHNITKTHYIYYQECDSLQARYRKDLSTNLLKCDYRLLMDAASNFISQQDEISLSVNPCNVHLRSIPSDEDNITHSMKTQMVLSPNEFTDFQVGVDTEITFCLKDLRSILSFCEVPACSSLQLAFDQGGSPLVVECGEERLFACTFVLATIATSGGHMRHQVTNNSSTWHQDARSRSRVHSNHGNHGNHCKVSRRPFEVPKQQVPPPRVEREQQEDDDVMNEFVNSDVTHNEVDVSVNQIVSTSNKASPTGVIKKQGSVAETFFLPSQFNFSKLPKPSAGQLICPNSSEDDTDENESF